MNNFQSFSGVVRAIDDFWIGTNNDGGGCYQLYSIDNGSGATVNFVVEPTTYFVNHAMVRVGDRVTGFYDGNVATPMIYPPQYRAVVMAKESSAHNVTVSFFNNQLVSSDGMLSLNVTNKTKIVLENGQAFDRYPGNRNLIVVYGATTRSIPAQTTPEQIIVMCR